mmetsp:Transcript_29196/g.73294  ORF Transcript_29196/g.73294 Transcript_29196/m.73294 type:complete len:219 (-) Transcript_29196:3021-3677(-)
MCTLHQCSRSRHLSLSASLATAGRVDSLTLSEETTGDAPCASNLSCDAAPLSSRDPRRLSRPTGPALLTREGAPGVPPPPSPPRVELLSQNLAHADFWISHTLTHPPASAVTRISFFSSVAIPIRGSCASWPEGRRIEHTPANTSQTEMHPSVPTERRGRRGLLRRKTMCSAASPSSSPSCRCVSFHRSDPALSFALSFKFSFALSLALSLVFACLGV